MSRPHPFTQLFLARMREFFREPEVIFWVYGFPLLLALGLGLAFASREPVAPNVDVEESVSTRAVGTELLRIFQADGIAAEFQPPDECRKRYFTGKSSLHVVPLDNGVRYEFDPTREDSVLARYRVDLLVQRWKAGVTQASSPKEAGSGGEVVQHWQSPGASWETIESFRREPGNRYIDFLMPGLMGLNLMGGGLWGVGFVIVDMRVRKLLKRLLATPMKRSHFMLAILVARLVFLMPEMLILLLVGYFGFGVPMQGNWLTLFFVILVGAMAFSGIGLLVASRAEKNETASGLMNLVMLPMWLLSGTFFSSKRFPEAMQAFVQALPLTQLNDAMREVMLEGASVFTISWRLAILASYAIVTFFLAMKLFRWK